MRVKGGYTTRRYRKKVLKLAKGYFGSKHRIYKTANEQVMKSLAYAYRDRRNKKRDFRKLWITRINAAANSCNISYSKLMYGLKCADVKVNRKMLSELAIHDFDAFKALVEMAKEAIATGKKPSAPVVEEKVEVKVKETATGVVVETKKPAKKTAAKKTTTKKVEEKAEEKPAKKTTTKKATTKKTAEKVEEKVEEKPAKKTAAKKTTTKKETAEKKPAAKKTTTKKATAKKDAE